jgi:DNA helicase-2/ATP-dependent DNA helicase PcrA
MEDEGVPLDEIAVLYRSHFHALELQLELSRSDIPFEVRSGLRFFEQAHVKDAAAFLRVATNPKDETAWKRALRIFPKIGKVTADKVWAAVERSADPLGELSEGRLNVPKAASTGVEGARQMLAAISRFADRPWDQIEAILAAG